MANAEEEACLSKTETQCQQAMMTDKVETDVETTVQDIKYDWYQSAEDITVTLFIKNVTNKNFNITFTHNSIEVNLKGDKNEFKNLQLQLFDFVRPSECLYKVLPTKVEVKLKKSVGGFFWLNLERKESDHYVAQQTDWDKIVKNEVAGDDTNSDINFFFQKIYNEGSDEVKRAMIKSFYESCGTVLTTNWDEAGSRQVGVQPPDGLEWKKW